MRTSLKLVLAVAIAAACASAARGDTFTVGTLQVEQLGAGPGRPLVLVPGLASGSWAWRETAAALAGARPVYLVTLAGFDGVAAPAGESPWLDLAAASLAALVRSRKLDHPVVAGHSLGGFVALRLAAEHPELLAGAVSFDGLPIFPGAERADAAGRAAMAAGIRRQMESLAGDAFVASQVGYMKAIGVVDPAVAERLGALAARSDPKAVGRYAGELLAQDLRPTLPRAKVPLLVLVPYLASDHEAPPLAMTQDQKLAYYRSLLAGAPELEVKAIPGARHFAMIDQPAAVRAALEAFLSTRG